MSPAAEETAEGTAWVVELAVAWEMGEWEAGWDTEEQGAVEKAEEAQDPTNLPWAVRLILVHLEADLVAGLVVHWRS